MLFQTRALFVCSLTIAQSVAWGQSTIPANFTYLTGPNFCQAGYGYTVPAFCTAPQELPLATFPIPPIGGVYTDPNFGAIVHLLTDGSTDSVHQYSTPSAFSAKGKYVLLGNMDGTPRIVEPATSNIVTPNLTGYTDSSSALWSATDDDVLFGIGCFPCTGSQSPTQIYKYQVSSQTKTVLIDYATDSHHFSSVTFGGTGDLSADNWGAFWAPNEHQVCAVDLNLVKTYCTDYTTPNPNNRVGWSFIDYVMISKGKDIDTGKRYVLLMASPAMGVYSVNEQTGNLDFEFRGPEKPAGVMGGDSAQGNKDGVCDAGEDCLSNPHADVFQDGGRQYLFYDVGVDVPACEDELSSLQISKGIHMLDLVESGGGRKNIFTLFKCGLTWSDIHFGCAKSANAFCVVSTDLQATNLPDQIRDGRTPFEDEVMVMRGNGAEVRRVAMHRSVRTAYWDTPRACISNDGGMVLWDSNFGNPANHRVALGETGFGTTQFCSYGLSTTNLSVTAAASSGAIWINPSSPSCAPVKTSSNAAWVTATTANNVVNWAATANTSSQNRNGVLTIAGEAVPVLQSGASCSYALSSTSIAVNALASSGTIKLSPSPLDCPTAPVTSTVAWASVSASGNSATWSLTANTDGKARTGSLTIGGQTVSIAQQQAPALNAFACFTTVITASGTSICLVALNAPALTPGSTIALTSSSASASVPATITVPTGAAFSWFRVTTGSVAGRTAVTLTVTYLGASKSFALTITPAAAAGGTAAFLKTDSTTIGFWKGVYGADGFELAGDSSSDPSYVTVTHSGNSSYNWSAVTTDPRALQKAASTTDRIAACWCSSTSFSIDLSFHDANVHQVAMYMLDWEPLGRAERVDILDANNNLLDTRPVTEFAWGHYLVWSLSGHVVVRVTATNASFAAAASGLFFR